MAGLTVCDASVLIAWLAEDDCHHGTALRLIAGAVNGALGISTLTLAEVLVGPTRAGRQNEVTNALSEIGVEEISLDGKSAALASIRAETGLRLPDCCVLVAAETSSAAAVLTFDQRLGRVARERGLVVTA